MYGENPVFPALYVKDSRAENRELFGGEPKSVKESPELDNVKGAVFQVQIPFKYKVRSRLRKLKAKLEKAKVLTCFFFFFFDLFFALMSWCLCVCG